MKLSFRWYGEDDKVTLENIRQIPGMHSIVTAVYDVPVGEVWSEESIEKLKKQVEGAGLHFEVIESIPVHEDIKLGKPSRDKYIENYCENIRRVAKAAFWLRLLSPPKFGVTAPFNPVSCAIGKYR